MELAKAPRERSRGVLRSGGHRGQTCEPRFAGGERDKRPGAAFNGPQSTGGDLLVGLRSADAQSGPHLAHREGENAAETIPVLVETRDRGAGDCDQPRKRGVRLQCSTSLPLVHPFTGGLEGMLVHEGHWPVLVCTEIKIYLVSSRAVIARASSRHFSARRAETGFFQSRAAARARSQRTCLRMPSGVFFGPEKTLCPCRPPSSISARTSLISLPTGPGSRDRSNGLSP